MADEDDEYGDYKEAAKTNPKLKPLFRFANQLQKESDRGLVLIASGYIEEMLKTLLEHFLLKHKDVEDLFDSTMPLGNLSGRIKMCFALGLLTDLEYKSLDQMRRIRNDFAHNPDVGFHTDKIIARVRNMNVEKDEPKKDEKQATERNHFTAIVITLMLHLAFRMDKVEKERRIEWSDEIPSLFGDKKSKDKGE